MYTMSGLIFYIDLDGDETLTVQSSGIVFTATGIHTITLPSSGAFSFVCANSSQENPRQITLLTESGTINGGDRSGSGLLIEDYGVITVVGEANEWKIINGYGAVSIL